MVKMRVGQQHKIDGLGRKSERRGVVLVEFAAALKQAAIDQHAPAGAFDQVARSGDVAIRAVK